MASAQAQTYAPTVAAASFTIGNTGDKYQVTTWSNASATTEVTDTWDDSWLETSDYYAAIEGASGTAAESNPYYSIWEILPSYTMSVTIAPLDGQEVTDLSPDIDVTLNNDWNQWEVSSAGGIGGPAGWFVTCATNDDYGGSDLSLVGADLDKMTPAPVQSVTASYNPAGGGGGTWIGSATYYYPSSTTWEDISYVSGVHHAHNDSVTCTPDVAHQDWTGTSASFYIPTAAGSGQSGAYIPTSGYIYDPYNVNPEGGGTTLVINAVVPITVSMAHGTLP